MRISDWSSDVCSSDLNAEFAFDLAGCGCDCVRPETGDRVCLQINQRNMVLRENLVISLFQRRSLRAERMRRFGWGEFLGQIGIGDPRANLVAPEIVGVAIGCAIGKQVGEVVVPEPQSASLP